MNIRQYSLSSMSALLIVSFGCNQPKPPEIVQLEYIIERDFADIPTAQKLIPFDLSYIKEFEEYPMEPKKIVDTTTLFNLPPPPAPDLRYMDRRCLISGHHLFLDLKRQRLIDKEAYDNIITFAKEVEGETARAAVDRAVPYTYSQVYKRFLFEEFQVFAYPIMTDDYLIIYRNRYYITKGMAGVGGGMFFVYKKVDGEWLRVFFLTRWTT